MNRIEIMHLDGEDRRALGPSIVTMRVRCDARDCTATSSVVVATDENDDFAREESRGTAEREGWKIGAHSDGRSDFCPVHAPERRGRWRKALIS